MTPDRPGGDHRFVTIDVAAEALNVSVKTAYRLARAHRWRRTPTRPYEYHFADIRTTYNTRNPN